MFKTLLIARREYLAFVRTVGFWLSLVTAPLIFALIIFVPLLIRTTAPVEVMNVALLDLTGQMERPVADMIASEAPAPVDPEEKSDALGQAARAAFDKNQIRLVPLPAGLNAGMSLSDAEAALPKILEKPGMEQTTVMVIAESGDKLNIRLWSTPAQRGKLQGALTWQIPELQIFKTAQERGLSYDDIRHIRDVRAEVTSVAPGAGAPGENRDGMAEMLRENAPRVVGLIMGFVAWFTIFSSSMILLGGVIEEKASKVLEVLLASASAESLLIGKVLGVAAVMATVGLIWGGVSFAGFGQAADYLPAEIGQTLSAGLAGLFTPQYLLLLLAYFIGGYLMFGVTFAAIGAFCETQKDAQAIMGPLMIVLMVPMLTMQAAIGAPNAPVIQWLSWVPIFTPFLMPLRLSGDLPWWEIALTLGGMAVAAMAMVSVGRRAFKQGALTGGKLSWGLLARIATRKAG